MKVLNLINKLNKLKIENQIVDVNGYNKDVIFIINDLKFVAGFATNNDTIQDFCREIYFDKCLQETERRFFDNFNKLLNYANTKN